MKHLPNWIETVAGSFRYRVAGQGAERIVLVHEMGGCLESWDAVVSLLTAEFEVLAYDMRGAGMSQKTTGPLDIKQLGEDLEALLDELGWDSRPFVICGAALGAAVAVRFAAVHPRRVSGLVGFSPALSVEQKDRPGVLALAERIEREGLGVSGDFLKPYPLVLREQNPGRFKSFRARFLGGDHRGMAAQYRMLATLDLTAEIEALRCPTLLVAGEYDLARPLARIEPLARQIRGARLKSIASGHFMSTQTPELVADEIRAFATSLRGAQAGAQAG